MNSTNDHTDFDTHSLDTHPETTTMNAATHTATCDRSAAASKRRRRTITAIVIAAATAFAFTAADTGSTDTTGEIAWGSTWS